MVVDCFERAKVFVDVTASECSPYLRHHNAHLQGVPAAVIAAWLGHADVAFTMRTYVHSQPDALADGARSLVRRAPTGGRVP